MLADFARPWFRKLGESQYELRVAIQGTEVYDDWYEFSLEKEDYSVRSRSSMLHHPLFTSHEQYGGYNQPVVQQEHKRRVDLLEASAEEPTADQLMVLLVETVRDSLCAPDAHRLPLLWSHAGLLHKYQQYSEYVAHRKAIVDAYTPLRAQEELFEGVFLQQWLHPAFLRALGDGSLRGVVDEVSPKIYCFPLFTDAFCDLMLEELDSFSKCGLPAGRPNSMNRYGLVLNQIGMEPMLTALQRAYVQPLASTLFPMEGDCLDAHHSFTVQYRVGEDLGLDMHTDASDVTLNVCLRDSFAGGALNFCGFRQPGSAERHHRHSHEHKRGYAVLHLGRQRHGAQDITAGERCNLIMWSFNGRYRMTEQYELTTRRQPETNPPDLVCLSFTHDADYVKYKELPAGVQAAAPCPCGCGH